MDPSKQQRNGFFDMVMFVAFLPVFVVIWVVDRITDAISGN